jgi:hypothetical protein
MKIKTSLLLQQVAAAANCPLERTGTGGASNEPEDVALGARMLRPQLGPEK